MALSPEEIERYARHIVMPEVGGPGQAKLITAKVLVIGAGGLGAPLLLYLAAAGVGTMSCTWSGPNGLSTTQSVNGGSQITLPLTNVNNSFCN